MNIPAQPVQLRHGHRAAAPSGFRKGSGELGATVQGICALAGLDLHELANDLEPFSGGEARECISLRLETKTRAALSGRDTRQYVITRVIGAPPGCQQS